MNRERDILTAQIRALSRRLDDVVTATNTQSDETTTPIIPIINNFCDNTDCIYSEVAYRSASYSEASKVLYLFMAVPQTANSAYVTPSAVGTEASSTTTGLSVRGTTHSSPTGGSRVINWEEATGSILYTGGHRLVAKIPTKPAVSGNEMMVRFQLSRVTGATITDDCILKFSIWDNNDISILTGTKPELTSTKQGTHTAGATTYQYILEVQMPDGRRFYTDTASFTTGQNQVINALATLNGTNYVSVSWGAIPSASRYNIYRSSDSGTTWYRISTVKNGITSIRDNGGQFEEWTVPTFDETYKEYQKAEVFITDLGTLIPVEESAYEFAFRLHVPVGYVQDGDQYIQVEVLQPDYTDSTTSEVSTDGLRIDRIGLSYTFGRWHPSARDLVVAGTPTTPSSPLPTGGGGGGGGVGSGCVTNKTKILLYEGIWLNAELIVEGDILASWDGEKIVPSQVKKVHLATTSHIYILHSKDRTLKCSPSHRLATPDSLYEGISARDLVVSTQEVLIDSAPQRVEAFEIMQITTPVRTFELEEGKRNYIADGWVSPNAKSPEI